MIYLMCLADCRAEIVVHSQNQPIKCWNCNRVWAPSKTGGFVVTSGPGLTVYVPLPFTRKEI